MTGAGKTKTIVTVLVMLGIPACALSPPPPKLDTPENAAIGISLTAQAPIDFLTSLRGAALNRVYFVKLDEEGGLNSPLPSNYNKGNQFYLLNAKPGRYVAVAGLSVTLPPRSYERSTVEVYHATKSTYTVYLSNEVIKLTEVDVGPGQIAFMGKYVIDVSTCWENADDAQLHSYRLLESGREDINMLMRGMKFGEHSYTGSLGTSIRGGQAEKTFLNNARAHLEEGGWSKMIEQRLKHLQTH